MGKMGEIWKEKKEEELLEGLGVLVEVG